MWDLLENRKKEHIVCWFTQQASIPNPFACLNSRCGLAKATSLKLVFFRRLAWSCRPSVRSVGWHYGTFPSLDLKWNKWTYFLCMFTCFISTLIFHFTCYIWGHHLTPAHMFYIFFWESEHENLGVKWRKLTVQAPRHKSEGEVSEYPYIIDFHIKKKFIVFWLFFLSFCIFFRLSLKNNNYFHVGKQWARHRLSTNPTGIRQRLMNKQQHCYWFLDIHFIELLSYSLETPRIVNHFEMLNYQSKLQMLDNLLSLLMPLSKAHTIISKYEVSNSVGWCKMCFNLSA